MTDRGIKIPRDDRALWPTIRNLRRVPRLDTGGAFRPAWREQNPAVDPKEPYGGEASSTGEDHGWSGCTMTAAALAYAYHVLDASGPWGGDLRHHQDDLSGGTDLYDARTAWSRYGGQTLEIRSGDGWDAVEAAHAEGRAIVIQGEGNVPGNESFTGGHACCIGVETHSDGRWLWGDPLASGWQWASPSSIATWAKALSSGIYFAVSAAHSGGELVAGLDELHGGAGRLYHYPTRDFFDRPGGEKLGDLGDAVYRVAAVYTDPDTDQVWYAIDGGGDGLMRWVKA